MGASDTGVGVDAPAAGGRGGTADESGEVKGAAAGCSSTSISPVLTSSTAAGGIEGGGCDEEPSSESAMAKGEQEEGTGG